ncbi:MAG: signal peptidase I [Myxococcota bacterium]
MDRLFRFVAWSFGTAIVLALVGRAFLFETWTVPSEDEDPWLAASIAPTLAAGDFILMLTVGEATHGDLVRCRDPEDPGVFVVGRIAGESGDTVEIRGATLAVNGIRYDAKEACAEPKLSVAHPDTGNDVPLRCSRVEFGGTWHYRASRALDGRPDGHRREVGAGRVFLLSDNRSLHLDSRDFGTVDKATCGGRISLRLWGREGWKDARHRLDVIR